jgi:hypothetical protein
MYRFQFDNLLIYSPIRFLIGFKMKLVNITSI